MQTHLTTLLDSEPIGYDTLDINDRFTKQVTDLTFANLTKLNDSLEASLELLEYAKEINDKKWQLKLINFKDKNGEELNSSDIKNLITFVKKQKLPIYNFLDNVNNFSIIDEKTFEISLKEKDFNFLINLSFLPIAKIKDGILIETGPYFKTDSTNSKIVLSSNYEYEKVFGKNSTQFIDFLIVRDEITRYFKFLNGEADLAYNTFYARKTNLLSKNSNFGIFIQNGLPVSYLMFNNNNKYLSKLNVRLAIAHAIDIDAIIEFKLKNIGKKARGLLPESHSYFNKELKFYEYNPKLSEKLLDDAGFFRDKKTNYRFTLKFKTTTNKDFRHLIESASFYLENIGIKIVIESFEPGKFWDDIRKGNFDLYTSRIQDPIDPNLYVNLFNSKFLKTSNRSGFKSKEFDNVCEDILKVKNIGDRKIAFYKLQKIINEELPLFPLWYWDQAILYNKKIKNVNINLIGKTTSFKYFKKE